MSRGGTWGYLGTYSKDRQPALVKLLVRPAKRTPDCRFVVAGPLYPDTIQWPANVERIDHLPPSEHRRFYNSQRFTLNVTRREMVRAGWSPSVRLFEAAACGVPIVSDNWPGLGEFFEPGRDIVVGTTSEAFGMHDTERRAMARRAREKVLANHTGMNRAVELESYYDQVSSRQARSHGHGRPSFIGTDARSAPQPRGRRAIPSFWRNAWNRSGSRPSTAVRWREQRKRPCRWECRYKSRKRSRRWTSASGPAGESMTFPPMPHGSDSTPSARAPESPAVKPCGRPKCAS